MTTLPPLAHWQPTANSLHRAALVIGAARNAVVPRQPNHLHLSLSVVPEGLSSGKLPNNSALILDFGAAEIRYEAPETGFGLPLAGHTQSTLATTLFYRLANANLPITPTETLDDQTPLEIDAQTASDYAKALYVVFTAAARFRARLYGMMSPVVVWPHHFDLSFLWFATKDDDEYKPHLNFGFAPFSPGIERPYLYAYVYPLPENVTGIPLPAPARWHTAGWTGALVEYDALAGEAQPEAKIEALLWGIYEALHVRLTI